MVEAQLRNLHVSLPAGARDEAEGVQEAVFYSIAEKQYAFTQSILQKAQR